MKTVQDTMIPSPNFCSAEVSIQAAAETMSRLNIGSLIVVDSNKKVIGIITDRDICFEVGELGKRKITDVKVSEIVRDKTLYTVSAGDSIISVLSIMRRKQIERLPVVDENGNLRGLISLNQIILKAYGSADQTELEYKGVENILKVLHSLANRHQVEAIFN